jgi:hypothetical protein
MTSGLLRLFQEGIKRVICPVLIFILFLMVMSACVDEEMPPPMISFLTEQGLVSHDTTLAAGKIFSIGFEALAGKDPLTNITIKSSTGGTLLDSGIHTSRLQLLKLISKGISDTERITVTVMDMSRNKVSVSILLTRDMNVAWGSIVSYPSLKIGAQASSIYQPCLSLKPGHVYPGDSASNLQELIDILYYYNPGGGVPIFASVFSSPGESEAPLFYPFLNAWVVKNSTYYNTTTLVTEAEFNACKSDSLLIAAYDEGSAKRKYKFTQPGNIIPFRIADGRKGIIWVRDIQGSGDGFADIAIKIQE